MVILGHVAVYGSPHTYLTSVPVRAVGEIGATGVDLFFVLSGFLITGILYDSKESTSYFKRFYIRRTLRIFPVYYTALLIVGIAYAVLPHSKAMQPMSAVAQLANWTYTMNFLVALRGWHAEPSLVGHFWSLGVEEQFYLAWPFVVWRMSRAGLSRLAVGGIVAALIIRLVLIWPVSLAVPNALLPARMDSLLIGALICLQMRGGSTLPSWVSSSWAMIAALTFFAIDAAVGIAKVTTPAYPLYAAFHFSAVAIAFGVLLANLVIGSPRSVIRRALESRGFRFFGKYSYAMYIFHIPVVVVLASKLRPPGDTAAVSVVVFGVIVLSLTTLLALLSWRLIERPCLDLKERLTGDLH